MREAELCSELGNSVSAKVSYRPEAGRGSTPLPKEEKRSRRETIAERLILLSLISDEARRMIAEVAEYLPERYLRLYNGAETDSPDLRDELAGLSLKASRSPLDNIEEETKKLIADLEIEALSEERNRLSGALNSDDETAAVRYRELTERIEEIKKRK